MNESQEKKTIDTVDQGQGDEQRREVLRGLGKWSGASVLAVVGAAAWISTASNAKAGWLNRNGGGGGGWVNGGGGGWVNRRGGGGWINRR